MKLYVSSSSNYETAISKFNKHFNSIEVTIIEREIQFINGLFYIAIIYKEKKLSENNSKRIYPDSRKCINLIERKEKLNNDWFITYLECGPCASKQCKDMFGSDFCFAHYKEKNLPAESC